MADMEGLVGRLEKVTLSIQAAAGVGGGGDGEEGPALAGWRQFMKESVDPFIANCNKYEGTKKLGAWTKESFEFCGTVIQATQDCAKPSDTDFMKFVDPIVKVITAAGNPDSRAATFPQEKSFAEVVQTLSFIMMPGPKAHIMGQLEAADFYLNKVLTAAKDKEDPIKTDERDYVKLMKKMATDMGTYANDFWKTGLTWKFGGANVLTWKPGAAPAKKADEGKQSLEARLAAACATLEGCAGKLKKGGDDDGEGEPARVTEWNAFYKDHVQPFIDAANKIEGTKKLATWTETSFKHMGTVMAASSQCKKPSQDELMKFLGPVVQIITDAGNPDSRAATFPQEKSFAECISAHSWIFQDLTKPFIIGQLEAADFYLNKVLTAAKDKEDPAKTDERAYVSTIKNMMNELAVYAGNNFKTGLEWNPKGKPLSEFAAAAPAAAAPAAAAPAAAAPAKPAGGLAGALGGLGAALAAKTGGAAPTKKVGGFKAVKKEPSIKVQQDKVFIENYGMEQKEPLVYKCEMVDGKPKTGVFVGGCKNCTIKIEGKAKNITISGCEGAGIVFESCVTTVEVINSKRCQIQGEKLAGTVMLDKCDRTKLYLPKESVTAPNQALVYFTQSSSSVVYYDGTGEDMEEFGAPEQILSTFEIGKAVETIVVIPEADKS